MRIGSLFSGIGGLELGLEWAGVGHTVWHSEVDPYASQVLAKHWPGVPNLGDITKVDWDEVEPVEVICGGFPCQDISLAGRGAGLAGERSGLWREYLRAVRHLRPRFVVVENVAALLARGLGDVLGDLAACGYDAEWDCIPAAAVGAPHRRDRLFVIAYADGDGEPDGAIDARTGPRIMGEGAEQQRHVADAGGRRGPDDELRAGRNVARVGGEELADTESVNGTRTFHSRSRSGRPEAEAGDRNAWAVEPDVGRVAHGVPRRVDRLRALGNAVVPQVAEVVGRRLMELAR